MNKLESVVIVTNPDGAVATIRFTDGRDDRIISSTKKNALYNLVEKHLRKVLHSE